MQSIFKMPSDDMPSNENKWALHYDQEENYDFTDCFMDQ